MITFNVNSTLGSCLGFTASADADSANGKSCGGFPLIVIGIKSSLLLRPYDPTALSAIHFYREHTITEEAKVTARLPAPPSLPERLRASGMRSTVDTSIPVDQILSAAAPNMTPAQIAEAQRMAREWVQRHPSTR